MYASGKYYAPTQGQFIRQNLDYMDWSLRSWFGGISSKVDLSKTQAAWNDPRMSGFLSWAPSKIGPAFTEGALVAPVRWATSMGIRQNQIMNYDTYYAPYGEAGKYLRVQDMMKQTEDIATATFAAFDAITWWNGIGTETVIARQALARLGLTADDYALLGMNAGEIVTLANRWQSAEEAAILRQKYRNAAVAAGTDDIVMSVTSKTGKVKYGSTDLSRMAQDYRLEKAQEFPQLFTEHANVAVFEYRVDGMYYTQVSHNIGDEHAERVLASRLKQMGIAPEQVTRVYTELQPCPLPFPGANCKIFLRTNFPDTKVTWSFQYGDTIASRNKGRNQLLKALFKLFGPE